MPTPWQDRIVSTPDVLRGKPRIKNTRIPASLILGDLPAGSITGETLSRFPDLTADDIAACLDYARDLGRAAASGC